MNAQVLIKYILLSALRDKMVIATCLFLLCCSAIAIFLGAAAAIEQSQFSLVFIASGLRVAGSLGIVLFVSSAVRRLFDSKDIEFILSRPISRGKLLAAHAISFITISVIIGIFASLLVASVSQEPLSYGNIAWYTGLLCEYSLMSFVALFFSMVLPSVPFASMATLGVYVLSRMSGEILGTINSELNSDSFLALLMKAISSIMPRLDLYSQSSWLVYGLESPLQAISFTLIQFFSFSALIILAALYDLKQKDF